MTKNNKKLNKVTPKKLAFFSLIALVIYLVINAILTNVVINISNSHSGTVFWKSDIKPAKNDFVYFDFEHELLPKNLKVLSKKLVCLEGDDLIINDSFIACNDKKYAIKRNKKTGSGKPITQFYYHNIMPKGKAIVWGSNPESFDSRYWGFIDYNELHIMKKIW